jgi:hypothetical protein
MMAWLRRVLALDSVVILCARCGLPIAADRVTGPQSRVQRRAIRRIRQECHGAFDFGSDDWKPRIACIILMVRSG